jgi:hypothetical protein
MFDNMYYINSDNEESENEMDVGEKPRSKDSSSPKRDADVEVAMNKSESQPALPCASGSPSTRKINTSEPKLKRIYDKAVLGCYCV